MGPTGELMGSTSVDLPLINSSTSFGMSLATLRRPLIYGFATAHYSETCTALITGCQQTAVTHVFAASNENSLVCFNYLLTVQITLQAYS